MGGGAPNFVAGFLQFAPGQFVVHQGQEMPVAFPVVSDRIRSRCSHSANPIRSAQAFQGADEFGDGILAVTDMGSVRRVSVKHLVIGGRNQVLPPQMLGGAILSNQALYCLLQEGVGVVRPAAGFSGGFDGVGGGAPNFVAGFLQFAPGQFIVHQGQEMPAAFPVVSDRIGIRCSHSAAPIRSAQAFQGADEFGDGVFAVTNAAGRGRAAAKSLVISGGHHILPEQMRRGAFLAHQPIDGFL